MSPTPARVLGKKSSVIVAAVDLSAASKSVFESALEIAHERPEAVIHLVHVKKSEGATRTGAELAELAAWAEKLPHEGAQLELHERVSARVPEAIVDLAAELDADVILVGTHGRTGMSRMLIGSVAESVARMAGCSVFIVRDKAHAASSRGD